MKIARYICVSVALFVAIADALLVYLFGIEGSVSRYMQGASYSAPLFVVMLGFLLGHFFSGDKKKDG